MGNNASSADDKGKDAQEEEQAGNHKKLEHEGWASLREKKRPYCTDCLFLVSMNDRCASQNG
jgi:hypothetical protein